MGDRDYVLPTTTVRNLNDKLYEKRKAAALEIERMVKEYHASQSWDKVEGLLRVLAQVRSIVTIREKRVGEGG